MNALVQPSGGNGDVTRGVRNDKTRKQRQSLQRSLTDFFNHAHTIPEVSFMVEEVRAILQIYLDPQINIKQTLGVATQHQEEGERWVRRRNISNSGFDLEIKIAKSTVPVTVRIEGVNDREIVKTLRRGIAGFKERILQTLETTQAIYRDTLTGLFNFTYYKTFFEGIKERVQNGEVKVGIVSIDIKNFGKINETYGHTSGDEILKNFGSLLKKCFPGQYDIKIVRHGGDEFMILCIFNGTMSEEYVEKRGESIMSTLNKHLSSINVEGGIPFQGQQQGENRAVINMHTGFAVWDNKETFRGVLDRADPKLNKKTA